MKAIFLPKEGPDILRYVQEASPAIAKLQHGPVDFEKPRTIWGMWFTCRSNRRRGEDSRMSNELKPKGGEPKGTGEPARTGQNGPKGAKTKPI